LSVFEHRDCLGFSLEEEDTDRRELALPGHQLQLLKDAIYYSILFLNISFHLFSRVFHGLIFVLAVNVRAIC